MDSLQFRFSVRLHAPRKSPIDGTQGSVLSGSDSEREEKNGRRLNHGPRLHRQMRTRARTRPHARAHADTRSQCARTCQTASGAKQKENAKAKKAGEKILRVPTEVTNQRAVQCLESSGREQPRGRGRQST